ncbi:MAG: hypothetical protein S4CHLAM6_10710 [Chlamydiae bacterium]|nr:hypothetical protein [Chlamydiota bacterium]
MSRSKKKQKEVQNQKEMKESSSYPKWITQGLIFSVALNLALLTSLVFNAVKGKEGRSRYNSSSQYISKMDDSSSSLKNFLIECSEKKFPDLVKLLSSNAHIEEGFSQRDIALSVLSHQYDLDVDRALMGQSTILRYIPVQGAVGSSYEYPVFSGLTQAQYELVQSFVKNEKWPLTSHGLYKKMIQGVNDESLKEAFYLSREFMYVEGLFCSLAISKEVLLNTILQGTWDYLEEFIAQHNQIQDFSNPLRIQFLSQYLEVGSQYAARLILEIDAAYALKKLNDTQMVALLGMLENKSNLAENFAVHLALGNRSDWVRQEACRLLYHYSDQNLPEPYSYQEAINFIGHKYKIDPAHTIATSAVASTTYEAPNSVETHKIYIVQERDNLWKIAKKNQVSLDELRKVNQLDSDLIKVGMTLILP